MSLLLRVCIGCTFKGGASRTTCMDSGWNESTGGKGPVDWVATLNSRTIGIEEKDGDVPVMDKSDGVLQGEMNISDALVSWDGSNATILLWVTTGIERDVCDRVGDERNLFEYDPKFAYGKSCSLKATCLDINVCFLDTS